MTSSSWAVLFFLIAVCNLIVSFYFYVRMREDYVNNLETNNDIFSFAFLIGAVILIFLGVMKL